VVARPAAGRLLIPSRMSRPSSADVGASPGDRARAAADALGDEALTRWCGGLLAGRTAYGDPGEPDPGWLGGQAARTWGSPVRLVGSDHDYWARTWAARTLLYVWDERYVPDIVAGLQDPAWRVREMCAKVAVRWEVGEAADAAAALVNDATPRVRVAGLRVLAAVGEHEHLDAVEQATDDEDRSVRIVAARTRDRLRDRLDR